MGSEEFKKRFLEEKIFKEQKDIYIKNIESFKRKNKGYDINFSEVYRRITNYQIEKYGTSLHCYKTYYTSGEGVKLALYSQQRRYAKRKRGGDNFDKKLIKW